MKECKHVNRDWLSYIDDLGDCEIAHYRCRECGEIFIDLDEDDDVN